MVFCQILGWVDFQPTLLKELYSFSNKSMGYSISVLFKDIFAPQKTSSLVLFNPLPLKFGF